MNQCRDRRPYQAGGAGDRTARRVVGVGSGNLAADPRIPMGTQISPSRLVTRGQPSLRNTTPFRHRSLRRIHGTQTQVTTG
jgi:hypothetical protein